MALTSPPKHRHLMPINCPGQVGESVGLFNLAEPATGWAANGRQHLPLLVWLAAVTHPAAPQRDARQFKRQHPSKAAGGFGQPAAVDFRRWAKPPPPALVQFRRAPSQAR